MSPPMRVRAWPLELVNGAPLDPDLATKEIAALREQVAPELFAGFDAATFPRTSIPAFGLVAAAYAVNDLTGEMVSLAVRDALFEQGDDISDNSVLRAIGRPFGIEPFDRIIAESAVRADWERGKARGVQGSPHFFVGDRGWFCPSLDITYEGERFEIQIADEAMRDFYAAALG
jgi:2-hydroxychromene-2-carboxylate isomerase